MKQSESDGMTVPILYEGRTAEGAVADGRDLDQFFEDMFRERSEEELEAIKRKYATRGAVLDAKALIEAKARDMLRHYVEHVLPSGLKAQVVSYSRQSAVRYQKAFVAARDELVGEALDLDEATRRLDDLELQAKPRKLRSAVRAWRQLEELRRLEFAAEKALLDQPVGAKRFASGEGFPYLGRSYRLLLVDEQEVPLKLERGRFRLRRADVAAGKEHFVRWYREHARSWLERRVRAAAPRIDVVVGEVRVLDLGFRWGSCGRGGTVNFHWAVILLPPKIVDYVIVHELVHLHEKHHTPEFWRRVERAMPDYERRKAWLARRGGSHLTL